MGTSKQQQEIDDAHRKQEQDWEEYKATLSDHERRMAEIEEENSARRTGPAAKSPPPRSGAKRSAPPPSQPSTSSLGPILAGAFVVGVALTVVGNMRGTSSNNNQKVTTAAPPAAPRQYTSPPSEPRPQQPSPQSRPQPSLQYDFRAAWRKTVTTPLQIKEGLYTGEIIDGKPDGQGTLTLSPSPEYPGGTVTIKGTFENGGPVKGELVAINPSNNMHYVYKGGFRNFNEHGYAEVTAKIKGSLAYEYKGYYVDGKMEGTGTLTWADGSYYRGGWKANQPHGIGRFYDARVDKSYNGHWREGCPAGDFLGPFGNGMRGGIWKTPEQCGMR